MPSEKQIEAAADQISEGLGAFLRKFCDSEASKRARYYLHEMPKDERNQMALMLATEALTAAEQAEPAPAARSGAVKAEDLAVMFHDTYEELAPQFGYETRSDTKTFDPNSPNGQLMVAVCQRILAAIRKLKSKDQ